MSPPFEGRLGPHRRAVGRHAPPSRLAHEVPAASPRLLNALAQLRACMGILTSNAACRCGATRVWAERVEPRARRTLRIVAYPDRTLRMLESCLRSSCTKQRRSRNRIQITCVGTVGTVDEHRKYTK